MTYLPNGRPSQRLDFDQIQIGDKVELSHQLTKIDVDAFAALTGDFNPLHVDESFAHKTQFRKPVVHGMLSASFISTIIGMLLPGRGSLWVSQTIEFLSPAYIGDILNVIGMVKQKSANTRLVVLDIAITNQSGQKLIRGEATVKHLELRKEQMSMDERAMVVLVTGGGGGIGSAIAEKLAGDGHLIIIVGRRLAEVERVAANITLHGGRALALQANVVNPEEVNALFDKVEKTLGQIQGVVHCASPRNTLQQFTEVTWESMQNHIDVQVKGAFNCAQAALPNMLNAQTGNFVFIGSIAADGVPPAQQSDYVIAKSALTALARCLAVEYGSKGIRVNVVAPGMTQTDMISHLPDKAKMLTQMQTPLRRLADPSDIASVVSFLFSPAARHITGETIRVNGGAGMQ